MGSSPMQLRIAWSDWDRRLRFPGVMRGRRVKSEVHFRSMLTAKGRRDRVKHLVRLHFDWRKRGQYVPPLTFETR
jgi:hypothetical protein